jgi:lysozyme
MATCAVLVGGFEGLWCTAKPDTLAYGIPTVCYGETEHVKVGDHYTKQQCLDMLANKLPRYWSEIEKCIHVPTSDNEKRAYTSFAYNVGSAGFCRSATAHKLNAGDHVGACKALASWDRAGGRVVKGLQNRRSAEIKICLTP